MYSLCFSSRYCRRTAPHGGYFLSIDPSSSLSSSAPFLFIVAVLPSRAAPLICIASASPLCIVAVLPPWRPPFSCIASASPRSILPSYISALLCRLIPPLTLGFPRQGIILCFKKFPCSYGSPHPAWAPGTRAPLSPSPPPPPHPHLHSPAWNQGSKAQLQGNAATAPFPINEIGRASV